MECHPNNLQVSTSIYNHRLNRLELVIKSAIVGLIHNKTITSPSIAYDNGESTTLMSTDADSLKGIGAMIHETWAQVIEVIVGVFLLAQEVGWVWPLPLFLIYCKFRYSFSLSHIKIYSMLLYESFRCKASTASPKSVE